LDDGCELSEGAVEREGSADGKKLGRKLGTPLGILLGNILGSPEGRTLGSPEGRILGLPEGRELGKLLGAVSGVAGNPVRAIFTFASLFVSEVKVMVRVSPALPLKSLIV